MLTDTKSIYLLYINALNAHNIEALARFVHEQLSYNGKLITYRDYQDMLVANIQTFPDLHFNIDMLVVEDHNVACRLAFDCTPQEPFLGFKPNGNKVQFSENVFYKFRDGRIYEVWSIIDQAALADQLERTSAGIY